MTFLYILLALFVFGLLVLIHELGHFLMARAFGVGIKEFSIGMGPKVLSTEKKKKKPEEQGFPYVQVPTEEPEAEEVPKKTKTVYSLRAFPIGGYVSMVGEDEECDSPESFSSKKVWQRILIVIAGPLMNILLGFLLMLVLVLSTKNLASTTIAAFNPDSLSSQQLQVGDIVTHVDGVRVHTGDELVYEVMYQGYRPISMTVIRDGKRVDLELVMFPGISEEGVSFGEPDFKVLPEEKTFGSVMKHTFFRSVSTVKMIFDQLGDMLRGRFGLAAVSGPIGVTEAMGTAAQAGFANFLYLVIVITVNLGVFNLLPLPALDGGRLLFLLIELIIGRPVNKNVEGYIHFVGILLLFGLMILVACKDIAGLFIK